MIHLGRHSSAVIESVGQLVMPETTVVEANAVISIGKEGRCVFGETNIVYPNTTIRIDRGWMTTGKAVSFGPGTQIYEPREGLAIGDNCLLAGGVMICGVNHGYATRDIPMRDQPTKAEAIVIEDDVWLGMGAIVLPGVRIGRGAVIGAGSVVTKDIPAYAIGYGIPCQVVGERPKP